MKNGFVFQAGSRLGNGQAKTDGVHYFATTRLIKKDNNGVYQVVANSPVPPVDGSRHEFCKFDFSVGSANYNLCNGIFNPALSYTGVYVDHQTGKEVNQKLEVVADGQGYSVSVSGSFIVNQPVFKIFYKEQIGKYVLNAEDASALNYFGAGHYCNICYDPVHDCVILGSGNMNLHPVDEEYRTYKYLRLDRARDNNNNLAPKTLNDIRAPNVFGFNYVKSERNLVGQPLLNNFFGKDQYNRLIDNENYLNNRKNHIAKQRALVQDFDTWATNGEFSDRYRRTIHGAFYSINLSDGALRWVFRTWIPDYTDHSATFLGLQTASSYYRSNGVNQDCMPGATIINLNNKRYMLCANKSRMYILDLDAAYNTQLVGVNGGGNQHTKGIISGVITPNHPAVIYKDEERGMNVQANFNSLAYNPNLGILVNRCHLVQDQTNIFSGGQWNNKHRNVVYQLGGTDDELITGDMGILAVPGIYASALYFYNIPSIINNPTDRTKWNCNAFVFEQHLGVTGIFDGGDCQMYGDITLAGTKNGNLYVIDTATGNLITTKYINGGASITPLMVDGIMYGYGGNSKWNPSTTTEYRKNAKELFMMTPYGK